MFLNHRILFIVNVILASQTASKSVTIFTLPNFKGSSLKLNISNCITQLPPPFSSGPLLNSIHTQDNCVQLYRAPSCSGEYLIVKPGTQHDSLSGYGWANVTQSIGPCHTKCHANNIQRLHTKVLTDAGYVLNSLPESYRSIRIKPGALNYSRYAEIRAMGVISPETVPIPSKGCINTPPKIRRDWPHTSVQVAVSTKICVESHLLPDCKGASYRLSLGSVPTLKEANFQLRIDQIGSFSLCGNDCEENAMVGGIDSAEEAELHAAYLCGTKEYHKGHACRGKPSSGASSSQIIAHAPENQNGKNAVNKGDNYQEKVSSAASHETLALTPEKEESSSFLGVIPWIILGIVGIFGVAAILIMRQQRKLGPYPKQRLSLGKSDLLSQDGA